jgi:hypothetical protein
MINNSVMCSAIDLANRAIAKAMANQPSCEAELTAALGAIRYVREALERESEFKFTQFLLIDPTQKIKSLADPNLTEPVFGELANNVLTVLEQLKGVCGCPN